MLEDVVAETDDDAVVAGEVARHPDDLRDAARLDLHLVREVEVEQELVAASRADATVAEKVDEVAGVLLPGDDQDVAHTDPLEQLERVVDHRPATDREQVLVRHARQLLEPRCGAACADEALHAGSDATRRPRATAAPAMAATIDTHATARHIAASPNAARIWSPANGVSANAACDALP